MVNFLYLLVSERSERDTLRSVQSRIADSIFIGRAKRAPHWGVQSRFSVIYIRLITRVSVEYDEIFHE